MPLEREIKPENLEFKGYVVAPNADIAAARAYKIWGSGVYVVDSIRNIPVLYGVYDAEWNHVGVVMARTAAEARAEAEKKFGSPPAPLTAWNVDRISTGERVYAVYLIKGLEPTEVTYPPVSYPEEYVPAPMPTPTPQPTPTPTPGETATLHIESTPSGANVYIDGILKGQTPLDVEVTLGTHTIRVEKEGYEPKEESIDVTGDMSLGYALEEITPAPQPTKEIEITEILGGFAPPTIDVRATIKNNTGYNKQVKIVCEFLHKGTTHEEQIVDTILANSSAYELFRWTNYAAVRGDEVTATVSVYEYESGILLDRKSETFTL